MMIDCDLDYVNLSYYFAYVLLMNYLNRSMMIKAWTVGKIFLFLLLFIESVLELT